MSEHSRAPMSFTARGNADSGSVSNKNGKRRLPFADEEEDGAGDNSVVVTGTGFMAESFPRRQRRRRHWAESGYVPGTSETESEPYSETAPPEMVSRPEVARSEVMPSTFSFNTLFPLQEEEEELLWHRGTPVHYSTEGSQEIRDFLAAEDPHFDPNSLPLPPKGDWSEPLEQLEDNPDDLNMRYPLEEAPQPWGLPARALLDTSKLYSRGSTKSESTPSPVASSAGEDAETEEEGDTSESREDSDGSDLHDDLASVGSGSQFDPSSEPSDDTHDHVVTRSSRRLRNRTGTERDPAVHEADESESKSSAPSQLAEPAGGSDDVQPQKKNRPTTTGQKPRRGSGKVHDLKCKHCPKTLGNWQAYLRHQNEWHVGKATTEHDLRLQCPVCGDMRGEQQFGQHVLSHGINAVEKYPTIKAKYACPCCPMSFDRRRFLTKHINKLHKTDARAKFQYQCKATNCDLSYHTAHALITHFKVKHPELCTSIPDDLVCTVCGKVGASRAGYVIHFNTHHKVPCEICGMECANVRELNRHRRKMHAGTALFPVQDSPVAVAESSTSSRKTDGATNAAAPPYIAPAHRTDSPDVEDNRGQNFHYCTLCPDIFKTASGLDAHKKVHERFQPRPGGKPFPCDLCYKDYDTWSSLWQHNNSSHYARTTVQDFPCLYCSHQFDTEKGLVSM